MPVIALCNQKGGVGKSTTTYHLARAAVVKGLRTLVIDSDPQGSITALLAAEPVAEDQVGLADALSIRSKVPAVEVIVPGLWDGLDLLPTSGETLAVVRDELVVAGAGRERRLAETIALVIGSYDLVLIDCPPSLDQLTMNALTAADAALVVTQSKLLSSNSLASLLNTIDAVHSYYNPQLRVAGILVNQHEERTVSGRIWLEELTTAAEQRSLPLLSPPIPKRVSVSDAAEESKGLDEWGTPDAAELAALYTAHLQTITETLENVA